MLRLFADNLLPVLPAVAVGLARGLSLEALTTVVSFKFRNPVMIKRIILCLLLGLLTTSAKTQEAIAPKGKQEITIGERISITSKRLGEKRSYWVYLPASYNDNSRAPQRYPVVYLLDGTALFHSVSGVVRIMSEGAGNLQIPELIIVAIPNTNRIRDLTPTHTKIGPDGKEAPWLKDSGGGRAFLQFIRDELFPEIESTYRTLSYRVLVGHSHGGLLALAALLDTPEMFQAYLAIDPSLWWDDQVLVRRIESGIEAVQDRRASVYISMANEPDVGFGDPEAEREYLRRYAKALASAASPGLRSTLQYFETEDHFSVALPSLYQGLLYIFGGYKPPAEILMEQPSAVFAHFQSVSERLSVVLQPPLALVNMLGSVWLYRHQDVDKTIELFKLYLSFNPESFNMYERLGEAYVVKGDKLLAIEQYEQSLKLNPASENARKQLASLSSQERQR